MFWMHPMRALPGIWVILLATGGCIENRVPPVRSPSLDPSSEDTVTIVSGLDVTEPGGSVFCGRVVYRDADGSEVSLTTVRFYLQPPPPREHNVRLEREPRLLPIRIEESGRFSYPFPVLKGTTRRYRRGQLESTDRWVEDVTIVLKARRCDDLAVHFTEEWKEATLVMNCPGRKGNRR